MAKKAIGNISVEYKTIRRPVKYPRLEFTTGELVLILPEDYGDEQELLEKKKQWILGKAEEIERARNKARDKHREDQEELSVEEFKSLVMDKIREYGEKYGIEPGKVFFRIMKSKWGSCSAKNYLTLNTRLRFLPQLLIEYVVFHEFAHLLESRHNERFWSMIQREFPDYEENEQELLIYWFFIHEKG